MRELAARVPASSPVTVNIGVPGFCNTDILREYRKGAASKLFYSTFIPIIARTPEAGGRALLHAAVTTEPEKMLWKIATPEKVVPKSTAITSLSSIGCP